jgi:hypothetical protein
MSHCNTSRRSRWTDDHEHIESERASDIGRYCQVTESLRRRIILMGEFRRQCGRWVRLGNTMGTRNLLPGRKSLATGGAINEGSRVPMANPKQVVDVGVGRQESLSLPG